MTRVVFTFEYSKWDTRSTFATSTATSMLWSSIATACISGRSVLTATVDAWRRFKVRKVKLMVGNKGPFNLNTPDESNQI